MEQQDIEIPSTSPSSKQRRDTQIYSPLPRPLLQPEHRDPQLSSSEPTLRFPLPQGDQNLAHWISSSDPDIMHLTSVSVEDAGLSESTYELIGGTDTESQDGNYLDNISESVGSLDMHRPDDVISLAGTENTCDEDSVADVTEEHHAHRGIDEHEFSRGPELSHFQLHHVSAAENSDDDDNSSKASLEYADNSLRTPSILTPEASRYLVKQDEVAKKNFLTRGLLWTHGVSDSLAEMCLSALPVFVALLAVAIVTQTFVPSAETDSEPAVSGIAAVPTVTPSTRSQHQNTVTLSSPTSGVALIPLTSSPDEGLFRSRKPTVSFTPHGKNDVLIHVAQDVRDTWMTSKCLDVSVLRSTQELEFSLSAVDDGILVKFPRREAYGVVNLSIKSMCRPKTEKAIKVHFGKGIIVDAFERTKSLAQDLSELVPVAVYEAERCLAGARRVLGSASDSFSHAWLVGAERAQDLLISANIGTGDHLASSVSDLWRQAVNFIHSTTEIPHKYSKYAHSVRSVQAQLRLGLLDAQISARMWWLKIQGKDEEYQMYASMAQVYLQQKKAAAKELLQKLQSRAKTTA
ncbi:hypothetical protein ISF_07148 [Cordyceps fumosorosea ARSEF 2679]|uniref:Uncharacterized protein n=1 Tax=Cordyceps fumosorosea (strain ARSEF 2679) TaxID=1081104 RepID=A0A167Q2P7_CORFA|nr:hypothetical protein ISF_07148 [Cordyceps fumosorosea ARSEF 2679]OAA57227.1 hypothetical protein ISF_07148 [Cordyceps fumosorosea ARSEF 2679]